MSLLKQSEDGLEGMFKGLPPLPEGFKDGLVKAFPWIALIIGIGQALVALSLWHLAHYVNALNDYVNSLYQVTGQHVGLSSSDKMVIYLGIIFVIADAVILLMAVSPLMKRARTGWDLLFLSALINLVYGVVAIFINGRGFASFIGSLIGSAIAFYLLFQIRDKYGKAVAKVAPTAPKVPETKDQE